MKFDLLMDGKYYEVELGLGKVVTVKLDGEMYQAEAERIGDQMNILLNGERSLIRMVGSQISIDGRLHEVEVRNLRRGRPSWCNTGESTEDADTICDAKKISFGEGMVYPPMPGRVVSINVNVGDTVKVGSPILVLEAMKMQNELVSRWNGTVREIKVSVGDLVESADLMMTIGN